jgi:hypothetical protein
VDGTSEPEKPVEKQRIETSLSGYDLINQPMLKGCPRSGFSDLGGCRIPPNEAAVKVS